MDWFWAIVIAVVWALAGMGVGVLIGKGIRVADKEACYYADGYCLNHHTSKCFDDA